MPQIVDEGRAWRVIRGASPADTVAVPSSSLEELPVELEALLRAFGRHLSAERGLSPHTVRAYVKDAESLLGHVATCGIEDVAEIDVSVIRAWLATQHAAGQARTSIARRAASARALTGFAYERGLLSPDPGALIGALKTRRQLPEVLGVDEVMAVLGNGRRTAGDADSSHRRRGRWARGEREQARATTRAEPSDIAAKVAAAIGVRDT